MNGIPDKVIKLSGRWKSDAFEKYVDQAQLLQLQLQCLRVRESRLVSVGGIGKLSSITPPTQEPIINDFQGREIVCVRRLFV